MSEPFFIVGCPRSGTTILRDLLRAHPNLTVALESHFVVRFYRAYGDPRNEAEARRLATAILGTVWIRAWELDLQAEDFASCRSYREILDRLFGAWAQREHKPRWGDKTPDYLADMPTLLRIYPQAKFIHIYRDGRDVAISWLEKQFGPRNLYVAAEMWRDRVIAGRRAGATLPSSQYLEVRYASLLEQPETVMRTICEFLGEPFCPDVLRPNLAWRGRPSHNRGQVEESIAEEILRDNAGKWKTRLSSSEIELFESVAGELLSTLGYGTSGRTRPIRLGERLVWRSQHWVLYWTYRLARMGDAELRRTFWQFRWAESRSRWRDRTTP